MRSIILSTAARLFFPLLLVFSLIVLYRGHNLPGGGFIGGLIAASGFILYATGIGTVKAREVLRINPETLIGVGLLVAVSSGLVCIPSGLPVLTGVWLPVMHVPLLGDLHLGTPMLFDVGVYLAVLGFVMMTFFSLADIEL